MHNRIRVGVAGYSISILAILSLWQIGSSSAIVPLLFPSPLTTLDAARKLFQSGQLTTDIVASVSRIAMGFALGSLLGVFLGVLMGSFRLFRLACEPYIQFFRALPALAWIPAAMLWFGVGEASKVILLAYTTVFVVAFNTMLGVLSISRNQLRAAGCFGLSPWQTFYLVKVPATVAHMLTGMRLAMGNCFSTIVAAELLAPRDGLGYLIFSSRTWMQTEFAFVGIAILGLLGFLADAAFHVLTKRFFKRYL
ncbi:ABC transporter permease [Castellaniella sp.]|uniref:ABC transporter permease n=1 Tax=Castellaniella sp. TaxID=1955812 RepID=UPI003A90EF4D